LERPSLTSRATQFAAGLLLAAAFAAIQTLIGGTRLLFSFPAYAPLGLIGLLGVFWLRSRKPPPNSICLWSAVLFFGYIIARCLCSAVIYTARPDLYSVLAGILVYFFVALVFTSGRQRLSVLIFLLAFGVGQVFIGAIQFRDGNNYMPFAFLQRFDYGRRASGFYICPNHFAGLLEVLGLFGVTLVCWSRWPVWAKMLVGYGTAICYAGLVLTGSRGGYLSAAASLLALAFLSLLALRRTSSGLFFKIAGAATIAAALLIAATSLGIRQSSFLSDRVGNIVDRQNPRFDLWRGAIDEWNSSPIWGTGAGTYLYYGRRYRAAAMQLDPAEAHNDYLHLLGEYGAIGGLTFLIFLAVHLRSGWRNFQRLGPRRIALSGRLLSNNLALNIAAFCAVIAYVVHSVFDFNLHIPANVLLLALVFGILANSGMERGETSRAATAGTLRWRLLLPVLGVLLLTAAARFLPGEYFTEKARVALREERTIEAIRAASEGLKWEQRNPDLYRYLGRARTAQGSRASDLEVRRSFYEAALAAFERGWTLAPQDETFAIELGRALDALDRFAEAETWYGEALDWDPRSVSARQYYEAHLERWRNCTGAAEELPSNR
jgi:O-antigen ligase